MIKIDLITGFLGSGKTTFIRKYAKYLESKGERICIIENDHGSVNVDLMLLNDIRSSKIDVEMVACACSGDKSSHKRRYRAKLITSAMLGYNRVIVEPSGIYDIDEFFDTIYEDPLDRMYEIGNVIAIVDSGLEDDLSKESNYILASEVSCAGAIIFSRIQEQADKAGSIEKVKNHVKKALTDISCNRNIDNVIIAKPWDELTTDDFEKIKTSSYVRASFVKMPVARENEYKTFFYVRLHITKEDLINRINKVFADEKAGNVIRIKGFLPLADNKWVEVNATKKELKINEVNDGQEVLLVIGECMDKDVITGYFPEALVI
ncbi:putative GTPase [Anaeromyces robustus]|jgi:G3E family GTPase|uniref:Putative GTPase n=1 Tax=Anaeromyces robustus TaxID=1754192 RepID=A0A1Y1WEX3_9FUNG|nr:putative GTPase [Anaeromyces robustus]|eukprot:ORX71704.1 putative GTPase [Anaeromyces robustus]